MSLKYSIKNTPETGQPAKVLYLEDGTELRFCEEAINGNGNAKLYCSRAGKFYSLSRCGLNEVMYMFSPSNRTPGRLCHNGVRGNLYPKMRHFGNKVCHLLVATAWIGPRPEGYECDHINGDIMNWSADNLQWVTPKENRKRAKLLKGLRFAGRDPKTLSREELLDIFASYEIVNPETIED